MNTTFNFPVPSPDSVDNYATLKGGDSDSDGIRDDNQRSIINVTSKNAEFKTDLEELARIYQRLMEIEDNTSSVGKVHSDLLLKKECMKNLVLIMLIVFLFVSCSKKKEKNAIVKTDTVLDLVESFTGFEESRYLVSGFISVLEASKSLDLKNKTDVEKWWDSYHEAYRCLFMIRKYNSSDKLYHYESQKSLVSMLIRRVLGDDFKNFSYLMTDYEERSRPVRFGDDEQLYDNSCDIPKEKFDNFQVNYVLNSNHAEFDSFHKFKDKKYQKQYRELYEKIQKIRSH